MKKLFAIAICIAATGFASAQVTLVKEAERTAKSGKFIEAINQIQPALTNPETAKLAQTWFIPGKAGFDYYNEQFLQRSVGKKVDGAKMAKAIIDAYGYFMEALPLDSLPDAKGKVKPKYSKDIMKYLTDNYDFFNSAAVDLWDAQDYKGAYDAWDIVINMPKNPKLGEFAPKGFPDSTMVDIMFNQGLAAWQLDSIALSLKCFERAIAAGYDKPTVYDYAISHAARLEDNPKVFALAEQAYKKFGNTNPLYLQLLINRKIEDKEYAEANKMLDEAISVTPNDAQLYNTKGILYEAQDDMDNARKMYEKAAEVDPENAQAHYNIGRMICNDAYKINDQAQADNLDNAAYNKLRAEKLDPLFRQAAKHLEAAYLSDPNNKDVTVYLRNVYYNLGDEDNLKRFE